MAPQLGQALAVKLSSRVFRPFGLKVIASGHRLLALAALLLSLAKTLLRSIATNGASAPIVKIKDGESQIGAVQFANDTQIENGAAGVAVQASQLKTALADFDAMPDGSAEGDLTQWDGSKWPAMN